MAVHTDREMVCTNWGCGKDFIEDRNEKYSCQHHPGRFGFASVQGLWNEGWSCCRQDWDEAGCRKGYHKGHPKDHPIKLCINHGEPNQKTYYPDSFCGKAFVPVVKKPEWKRKPGEEDEGEPCFIHSGYYNARAEKWTCCNGESTSQPSRCSSRCG